MATDGCWQFWIDRGGTFTDCLGRDPDTGQIQVLKVLSSDRAPLVAIRRILNLAEAEPVPPCQVRMGTTVATNALLERRGRRCALVITRGFGDLLRIGTQARADLFALHIQQPTVLYDRVLEIDARAAPDGSVLARPDPTALRDSLAALVADGFDSVAVVVLHAFCAGELEREIGRTAKRVGFEHVALSHELAAQQGMLGRGDTAVVDAYLTPLLHEYLAWLQRELPGSTIRLMQSSGGLAPRANFRGPAAVLSGPAGGVVACAHIAGQTGLDELIGLDMGGTSTDVCRVADGLEQVYESETAGVRLRAPMLAVHTVAAGGGSICRFDGQRFVVGPQSAGAEPGPLCYGRSGARELTVTDVNLFLGRVLPDRFPFPLDRKRVITALTELAERAGYGAQLARAAAGFHRVANERMAEAIKQISVAKGYDVRQHGLLGFGGAAGQHACGIARCLGMRTVVFHPYAGVLSAYGMGLAATSWHGEQDVGRQPLSVLSLEGAVEHARRLSRQGRETLLADGFAGHELVTSVQLELRYRGTETSLSITWGSDPMSEVALVTDQAMVATLSDSFARAHQRLFGYRRDGHRIEQVNVRVTVSARHSPPPETEIAPGPGPAPVLRSSDLYTGEGFESVNVYLRERLGAGHRITGPAIVIEPTGTVVLDPGFELEVDRFGRLLLHDQLQLAPAALTLERDPVQLELFVNQFTSVAKQMGNVLRRTALSTNIRERLDFSCALFDRRGELVANAPHVPVHLGAMEQSVKAVIAAHPEMQPGDAFITNDPAQGGSHLPDITVVSPVHDRRGQRCFYVASRGHHADVGGQTPGSMPPDSQRLEHEGVVLRATRIVRHGRLDETLLRRLLSAGPWPARDPAQNVADIEAQLAANSFGRRLLGEMTEKFSAAVVAAYMDYVQDNAAQKVAEAISQLADGVYGFTDQLDDGTPIQVALRVVGSSLEIDFTGTGKEVSGNLNAPRAVTIAAIIYVLRLLVGQPLPLASGCLRPVTLHIPPASVLDPSPECAVAGGNVETSQRVVDVLLGALGLAAASQGTMNNISFGTDAYAYYETIGGGAGAGPDFPGASAVHTHMTNTRITDPEVIEARFPVRMLEFSVRTGSGGKGYQPGGDGLVRRFETLEPMTLSVLTERRNRGPYGLCGGEPGQPGRNTVNDVDIGAKATVQMAAGDRVCIATPGGGGYGEPNRGE